MAAGLFFITELKQNGGGFEMKTETKISPRVYVRHLADLLTRLDVRQIDNAVRLIENAWHKGRQIICFGNGGSALTALHYVNDWNKSIYVSTGIPFRGRTLCDNIGLMMAYSNDISYEDVFVEQLKNVMQEEDLVVAVSGSGNSKNVIRAVEFANWNHAITLGICGYDGGRLKEVAQYCVWADVHDMQLSEDVAHVFGHIVMRSLCGSI